jgi:molybdopterin-binding protein
VSPILRSTGCWRATSHSLEDRERKPEDNESLGGLSARNRLFGYIEEVRVDGLPAQVQLRVGDQRLTAVITSDAVRGLKLRRGDDAIAIVKSTEVMIALPPTRLRATKGKQVNWRRSSPSG